MKPILAIVGRPNVGKSTLFNKIAGKRISIVEDTPGVTRDRIYAEAEWLRYSFTMIDTGGLDPDSEDVIVRQIFYQAELAMEMADVIIFLVDGRSGLLESDLDVANFLRRANKPVVLVVNKIDDMRKKNFDIYEFYKLGLGDPFPISAGQGLGTGDLLDEIVKHFPQTKEELLDDDIIRVSVIGKPNVGKSSLINRILGENRLIVSDIPGTTRDAVDSYLDRDEWKYIFIDTAGLRRKSKIKENIERYSVARAFAAVQRSDVCVIMINAQDGISEQDSKIAGIAHDAGKAALIAVNQWDKIQKDDKTMNRFSAEIEKELPFMPYAPKIYISALTGQRLPKLYETIQTVYQNTCLRIATGVLNDVIMEAAAIHQPPTDKGRMLKIYYATQVSVKPPTFILFVNDTNLMHYSYKRFLENQIRESFGFTGTPIHFILRNRKS